jgi:hypothetical protein
MVEDRPTMDDRDPADAIRDMVEEVLELAATWPRWDGRPCPVEGRIYTPHKAIRRVADHMIDHLAQLEAHLAGSEPLPGRWHGSFVTTDVDVATFSDEDLNEATNSSAPTGRALETQACRDPRRRARSRRG